MSGTGATTHRLPGGIGDRVLRPDGPAKADGRFAFSGDLSTDGMLHGATLRSPHAHARIRRIDVRRCLSIPGVACAVTAADVPGAPTYGLVVADQPVFARDVVMYHGQPVAAVAANHPEAARRALAAITVDYDTLEPLVDPEVVVTGSASRIDPSGSVYRYQRLVAGDPTRVGDIQVEGTYRIGEQDQAFLGTEAALALPDADGAGVELYVATQSLHDDQRQIAACLGLAPERVRLMLGGVGGAFGGREDLSVQVHAAMLALRAGRAVRMQYSREESFLGHAHRHPATIWMRHHADHAGRLVKIEARVVLDGGAFTSTSPAVLYNTVSHLQGPYRCDHAAIEGWVVRTNNPPCGAMRGFGVVQACFAHESQMDRLAAACGLDPVEIRLRNALVTGDRLATGQVLTSVAPVARCIRETAALPMPPRRAANDGMRVRHSGPDPAADVVRGVGFGVAFKNLMYSEGRDDFVTARCRLVDGVVMLKLASVEVGQGLVAVAEQVARSVLGVERVVLEPADTSIGSAGSTSASRQTWMSGGAIDAVCRDVRAQLFERVAAAHGVNPLRLEIHGRDVVDPVGDLRVPVDVAGAGEPIEATVEFHHRSTVAPDERGQGDAHVAFAFVAHRAVVDVDIALGLVSVVQVATAQDVGVVVNPLGVLGQIEGGIAQGLGLALMEELVVEAGVIQNPSFAGYLIPTSLDAPEVVVSLIEEYEPQSPLGAKGVGELPCISVTPAIVAAIRDATGRALDRVPVQPADICG